MEIIRGKKKNKHINLVKLAFILFSCSCCNTFGYAQKGNLEIHYYFWKVENYKFYVYNQTDTIAALTPEYDSIIRLNNIEPGFYTLELKRIAPERKEGVQLEIHTVEIKSLRETVVYFEVNEMSTDEYDIDTTIHQGILKERLETELRYFYGDQHWRNQNTSNKWNLGIGLIQSAYYPVLRHMAIIPGGGFSLGYASNRINLADTSHSTLPKFNYYRYLTGDIEFKIRFSTGNQQLVQIKSGNVFLDLGIRYQLPIIFKRVDKYDYREKHISGFLNNYKDFRAFVNLGNQYGKVFFEYNLSNFIKYNNPQLPKFTIGVKVSFVMGY